MGCRLKERHVENGRAAAPLQAEPADLDQLVSNGQHLAQAGDLRSVAASAWPSVVSGHSCVATWRRLQIIWRWRAT